MLKEKISIPITRLTEPNLATITSLCTPIHIFNQTTTR